MTFRVLEDVNLKTPEGILTLKAGQAVAMDKADAIPLIEAGIITPIEKGAYRIYSEVLQAYLWIVDTDKDMHSLRAQCITEAVYSGDEIRKLKGMDVDGLKKVHKVKEIFPESIIKDVKRQKQAS